LVTSTLSKPVRFYSEWHDPHGRIRPHYDALARATKYLGTESLSQRWNNARRQVELPASAPSSPARITHYLHTGVLTYQLGVMTQEIAMLSRQHGASSAPRAADTGRGYQTAINQALREYLAGDELEDTLRRVVREELRKTG